jgi:major intrinsic protein
MGRGAGGDASGPGLQILGFNILDCAARRGVGRVRGRALDTPAGVPVPGIAGFAATSADLVEALAYGGFRPGEILAACGRHYALKDLGAKYLRISQRNVDGSIVPGTKFVIMAVATDTRAVGEAAAIAIGGTVGLDAMFGGPISGASMNPARSTGPAFISGDLHALWLYILAPILGASLAALTYQFIRDEPNRPTVGTSPDELNAGEVREEELV